MTEVEEEAFIATSLGFPPYQRSHLPSKTYQAIVQLFSLFDQQSGNNLNSSASIHLLGHTTQEKEEPCFSNHNLLADNEVENRVEIEEPTFNSWGNVVSDSASIDNQIVDHIGLEQSLFEESVDGQLFDCMHLEPIEDNGEKTHFSEGGVVEERQDEGQEKEMGNVGDRVIRDSDIEEGEISGDIGEINLPDDCVIDDYVESNERKLEEEQAPKDKEQMFPDSKEQMGTYEKGMLSIITRMNMGSSRDNLLLSQVKEEKGKLNRRKTFKVNADDGMFDVGISKSEVKKTKEGSKLGNLSYPGAVSERVATENEGKTTSAKVVDVDNKRKRLTTEERRKKKKDKRREKRAEEDRKSGVKRLKILPITKPKILRDCKYYLHGKCQQGDSCKFSHDMIPLTKSKPCNFYALNKCLKGGDCAYDHELSKYPCDNYKSKGCCPRGATCLFSHQVQLVNDSSPASDVNKIAQEASANSGKQPHKGSTFQQNLNLSKSMNLGKPASSRTVTRNPGQTVAEMTPPAQTPKGISFLSFGKVPCDDSGEPQKGGDHGAAVCNIKQGASQNFHSSNEILGRTPAFKPSLSLDKNTPNSAQKSLSSTSLSASKYDSKMRDWPVQSNASNVTIPTVSNILQEFLFNGQ